MRAPANPKIFEKVRLMTTFGAPSTSASVTPQHWFGRLRGAVNRFFWNGPLKPGKTIIPISDFGDDPARLGFSISNATFGPVAVLSSAVC